MEPHNLTYEQEQEIEAHAPYLKVWGALLVFTVLEYLYAKAVDTQYIPVGFAMLVLGLMALATIKAGLVGYYFMHLKFEGKWVYFMIVPAGILAAILIIALFPDIGMHASGDPNLEEEAYSAPLIPGPADALRG